VRDPVEPGDVGEELGIPVVGLDLRGQGVEAQVETVFDEGLRDLRPVRSGYGGQVRRIGAGGAVDLAEELGGSDALILAAQPVDEDGELFAHRRRRRWLTVGVREHRNIGQRRGGFGEGVDECLRAGQPHLFGGTFDPERPGQVVDVFGGAAEVDEFAEILGPDLH
jgi:hypothetical protein